MPQDTLFATVRQELDGRLAEAVPSLLPGGRIRGREYVCGSIAGGPGESCRTNLDTGVGSDFATGDTWPDIIGLAAKVWDVRPREAAERLAGRYGIVSGRHPAQSSRNTQQKHKGTGTLIPIPANAPELPKAHYRLGIPAARWLYTDAAGKILFYVFRFETRDRGKVILPLCLCSFPDGTLEWQWSAWPAPRPLYTLHNLVSAEKNVPVLLVEGEKTADAAQLLFPDYMCTTWSGGCQAVHKTDFSPLRGRDVVIWPDNDKAGWGAAKKLVNIVSSVGAVVRVVSLPPALPPKWDLADEPPEGFDPQWYLRNVPMPVHVTVHSQLVEGPDSLAAPESCPVAVAEEPEDEFPYYLYVEKGSFTLTIYQKDENGEYTDVYKTYRISHGGNKTPAGKFELGKKERWHEFGDGGFVQYATTYHKRLFIHSPLYGSENNKHLWPAYYDGSHGIGKASTGGCLRMVTEASRFIYDECPEGTILEIVNGSPRDTTSDAPPDRDHKRYDPTDVNVDAD